MKFRTTTCVSAHVTKDDIRDFGLNPKLSKHGHAWWFNFPRFYTNKGIPFVSKIFQISFQWLCFDRTFYIENNKGWDNKI